MGSAASSPLSGRPRRALRYLSGAGPGKVCVCCWQSARREARAGGRAPRLFPFAFGQRLGLFARRSGAALAPGSRCPAGRRRAGARGARPPGAGVARLARRAEQARGPGGGAPTLEQPELEEEEEERRRRVAPARRAWGAWRPGRCCWRCWRWVSARGARRGAGGPWGPRELGGARLRRAAWAPRVPAPLPGDRTGVRGRRGPAGEDGGASREPGAGPARHAGGSLLSAGPGLAPHTCGGEWLVAGCPQPSRPVGRREPGSP